MIAAVVSIQNDDQEFCYVYYNVGGDSNLVFQTDVVLGDVGNSLRG